MAEYITKDRAKELVCDFCQWAGTANCEECEHPVDDSPAADVVPVRHGRWVYDENGLDWNLPAWCCSECHAINANIPPFIKTKTGVQKVNPYLFAGSNFCPNCGANMKGKTDG